MSDYIRPQVREMAAALRDACLSLNVDQVRQATTRMDHWLQQSQPASTELGFWQGVLRYCAGQNCDPAISSYLLSKSNRLEDRRSAYRFS